MHPYSFMVSAAYNASASKQKKLQVMHYLDDPSLLHGALIDHIRSICTHTYLSEPIEQNSSLPMLSVQNEKKRNLFLCLDASPESLALTSTTSPDTGE
jgi:hypothetical protein